MEQKRNTATQRDNDRAASISQRDNDRAASIRSEEYEARIAGLAESALNPIVEEVGTPQGNDFLESADINASGGGGGAGPFTVSISDDGLTVASGYYLTVNEPVFIAASDASAGSYAYIRLQHSSTGVLVSTDPFSTFITSTALDPDELDAGETFIEYSNCLLAAVVSDEVQQYRSGNVTLIHTTVNGKLCLWPYFEGGSA